jgi:hypothetical protein
MNGADCSIYSILKDFAGPIATVVAALAAIVVTAHFSSQQSQTAKRQAAQQAKTAIDQLRFNLFERRYAIYQDIRQFLRTLINDSDKPDFRAFDPVPHYRVIEEARFFFSDKTCQWLEAARDDCQKFIAASAFRLPTPPPMWNADTKQFQEPSPTRFSELRNQLVSHFDAMPNRFRHDMGFAQLTDPTDTV